MATVQFVVTPNQNTRRHQSNNKLAFCFCNTTVNKIHFILDWIAIEEEYLYTFRLLPTYIIRFPYIKMKSFWKIIIKNKCVFDYITYIVYKKKLI